MDYKNIQEYILKQQDWAYKSGPSGTWFERWIPGICKHKQVRCIHGDEIIARKWRRRFCMTCGKALKGPIPDLCFFTGLRHTNN